MRIARLGLMRVSGRFYRCVIRRASSPIKATGPLDEWAGRTNEPDHQGRHCQTLSLRQPRSAAQPSWRLPFSLQLRSPPQDAQGSHALRVRLQNLDIRAATIQTQSNPSDAGTEQFLFRCCRSYDSSHRDEFNLVWLIRTQDTKNE